MPSGDRFFRTTSAFIVNAGNLSESWSVRRTFFDSAVVTHSAKIGPLELSVQEKETVNVPIWAGVGAIVTGGILLIVPRVR